MKIQEMLKSSQKLGKYDSNCESATHTILVTLMQENYVGHIVMQIGGNCKGKSILECIDFYSETEFNTAHTKNDCEIKYHEEGDFFTCVLRDKEGKVLFCEEDSEGMNDMIVSIEIIAVEQGE
jgi:hypothetical protein